MPPAISPACSCSGPSSVEIDSAVACGEGQRQRAVLQLVGQRGRPSVWVKLPEIWRGAGVDRAVDPRRGDDLAVEGECRPCVADVGGGVGGPGRSSRLELKSTLTTHSPVGSRCRRVRVGDLGALDDGRAEQVLRGAVVASRRRCSPRAGRRLALVPSLVAGQRRRTAAAACSWVTGGRVRAGGAGRPSPRRSGRGGRSARPRRSARPGVAAAPSVGRRASGRRRAAVGAALPVGRGRVGGGRRSAASGPLQHRAEPQLGGRAELAGLLAVVAGHRDDDVRAALGDDLGLGDAEAVDALLDDLAGQLEVGRVGRLAVRRLGGEGDVVPPAGPGRAAGCGSRR